MCDFRPGVFCVFLNSGMVPFDEAREFAKAQGYTHFTVNDKKLGENPIFCVEHGEYMGFWYEDYCEQYSTHEGEAEYCELMDMIEDFDD